jgi:hypothetical protein
MRPLGLLHLLTASALLLSHGWFFFGGLSIERGRRAPRRPDRVARTLAQAFLPAAALTGLVFLRGAPGTPRLAHLLLGLAPLAAVAVVGVGRLALKRKRQWPWLLPALNLGLILAAFTTGLLQAL